MANIIPSIERKPIVKCVDVIHIRDWVPEPSRRRIDLTNAWRIIKNQYCAALVGRGVCPIQCEKCRETIVGMFEFREQPRNAEALLTWQAKDASAAMIERLIEEQKHAEKFPVQETHPYLGMFPKKKIENLFLEMLEDYK